MISCTKLRKGRTLVRKETTPSLFRGFCFSGSINFLKLVLKMLFLARFAKQIRHWLVDLMTWYNLLLSILAAGIQEYGKCEV